CCPTAARSAPRRWPAPTARPAARTSWDVSPPAARTSSPWCRTPGASPRASTCRRSTAASSPIPGPPTPPSSRRSAHTFPPAPGTARGLIVLPVFVAEGDEERDLGGGDFRAVWAVLRALRALDPRMAATLEHPASLAHSRADHPHSGVPGLVRFELDGIDLQ